MQATQPLVSIIIPTYNRAHILGTALQSVLKQTYQHWECLVVDDGSQDATVLLMQDFIKKDQRIQYHQRNRAPKGAPTCRNIGLEHAKGDYVIFLDSDDYLLPHCLKQRVETFNSHPDCHFMVFPMAEKKGDIIKAKAIPNYDDYLIPFLSASLPWSIMCPIWKRTFLQKLNGFTEGYPRFNDPELMIRALLQDGVMYKVMADYNYDSVFIPSPKQQVVFNTNVYESLKLFVPDIAKQLQNRGKECLKVYLLLYLHLWFKYFYVPMGKSDVKQSIQLLQLYKGLKIINVKKYINLVTRLLIYAVTVVVLPKPIDKLTEKRPYKPNDDHL